jgi:hypothetical protein
MRFHIGGVSPGTGEGSTTIRTPERDDRNRERHVGGRPGGKSFCARGAGGRGDAPRRRAR